MFKKKKKQQQQQQGVVTLLKSYSIGIEKESVSADEIVRYGIGPVRAGHFDPVQSLLALGTFDGRVFVFGQEDVQVVFTLQANTSVQFVRLHGSLLCAIDSKSNLTIFSLESLERIVLHTVRGKVTCVESDVSLDWLFLGLSDGTVDIWDLDRECIAPYRIPNLYRERQDGWRCQGLPHAPTKYQISPVIALQLHPRDIGTLLVGYPDGAVVYSFKENVPKTFFELVLPAGSPGGTTRPDEIMKERRPPVVAMAWHPNGYNLITCHGDGCIAFWCSNDGHRPILVRTVELAVANRVKSGVGEYTDLQNDLDRHPIFCASWICKSNPDETLLLVAGGYLSNSPVKGLTLFDFGLSPSPRTASMEVQAAHYATPKRQTYMDTGGQEALEICLFPQESPYFGGGHLATCFIAILANGEITGFRIPSALPLSVYSKLPAAVSFISPTISCLKLVSVPRSTWKRWTESTSKQSDMLLKGGAPAARHLKAFEYRNVLVTGHRNGQVRVWDASHSDLRSTGQFELDARVALSGRGPEKSVFINCVGFGSSKGEIAVGLDSGEVIIYTHRSRDDLVDRLENFQVSNNRPDIEMINHLAVDSAGFLPYCIVRLYRGAVTSLEMSDIGFIAIGYESGTFALIDMRGPTVLYQGNFNSVVPGGNAGRDAKAGDRLQVPATMAFAILMMTGDHGPSIYWFVGGSNGSILQHVIQPESNGRYSVHFHSAITSKTSGKVVSIMPISSTTGLRASATPCSMRDLIEGGQMPGFVTIVQETVVNTYLGKLNKYSYVVKDGLIMTAGLVECEVESTVLVLNLSSGRTVVLSMPNLQKIVDFSLPGIQPDFFADSVITSTGDIIAWTSASECSFYTIFGRGRHFTDTPHDALYDVMKQPPTRPSISTFQWVLGTQFISPESLNLLIAGPNRPLSKKQITMKRATQRQQDLVSRATAASSNSTQKSAKFADNSSAETQSYFSQIKQQIGERGEKLANVSEHFGNLEQASAEWVKNISNYAEKQKRKALLSSVTKSFF